MSVKPAPAVFVDTSVLYAHLDESDTNHEAARTIFEDIRTNAVVYRPLYVTSHVLSELVTLLAHNHGTAVAVDALDRLRDSSLFVLLYPDATVIDTAAGQLARYHDQSITLVDHLTAVLATEYDVDRVVTFDDDFRTLGYSLVPADTFR